MDSLLPAFKMLISVLCNNSVFCYEKGKENTICIISGHTWVLCDHMLLHYDVSSVGVRVSGGHLRWLAPPSYWDQASGPLSVILQ